MYIECYLDDYVYLNILVEICVRAVCINFSVESISQSFCEFVLIGSIGGSCYCVVFSVDIILPITACVPRL